MDMQCPRCGCAWFKRPDLPNGQRNQHGSCHDFDRRKCTNCGHNYLETTALELMPFSLEQYIAAQIEWSRKTFGPNKRTLGIVQHIRKELEEIASAPDDIREWVDVVILALDGAWRAGYTPKDIVEALKLKQTKNLGRQWGDWKEIGDNAPVEHIKGINY